jgi:hypothetical protein
MSRGGGEPNSLFFARRRETFRAASTGGPPDASDEADSRGAHARIVSDAVRAAALHSARETSGEFFDFRRSAAWKAENRRSAGGSALDFRRGPRHSAASIKVPAAIPEAADRS